MENKGYVTIKIETFDETGNRTNIECFSVSRKAFLYPATHPEVNVNLELILHRARKEILTPTPKTDMP
jgi:hypothetical protein